MRSVAIAALLALAGCGDNLKATPNELVLEADLPLMVSEAGQTATFEVALRSRPGTDVTLLVESTNPDEGTVSPTTIVFSPASFATPVKVTVTGIDDSLVDADQAFKITIDGGSSGAGGELDAINVDNDSAGITVMPRGDSTATHETNLGITAAFFVALTTQPTGDVRVPLTSADPGEGLPDRDEIVFTPQNWNAPVEVQVLGVDDSAADGAVDFQIVLGPATSTDPDYDGVDPTDLTFTNLDDDSPGVLVTPTSGLSVTEGATTATFSVVLTSEPTGTVVLDLSSSDPGEGRVSPEQLAFTPLDWNAPQIVTVTGVDDTFDDDDQSFSIVTAPLQSADAGYAGIDPPDVTITNVDDESPGFTITPASGLVTTEAGGTARFTIVLVSAPKATVTVPLATSDATEGVPTPTSVTFTTTDWNTPKTVTVTGVDDAVADGGQPYRILVGPATSTDPAYDGFDPPDVAVTNTDNDTAGITVAPQTGLLVSELGDSDVFDIVLASEPTANVTITLAVNDASEGSVMPTSVTFTPASWNVAQRITVTGKDDMVADGNQPFQVVTNPATSADARYHGINPANVGVTNIDDDAAQVVIDSPPLLQVSEAGTTATFTMVLTRMPTANVTCGIRSQNTAEGTVTPASVTFTPTNWDQPRTVTVTGVDDAIDDGDQLFFILTDACSSADTQYANFNPRDVAARNVDNDP